MADAAWTSSSLLRNLCVFPFVLGCGALEGLCIGLVLRGGEVIYLLFAFESCIRFCY